MTFRLHIDLGNDAMSEASHVAEALRLAACKIEGQEQMLHGWSPVLDLNGNVVGRFEVTA